MSTTLYSTLSDEALDQVLKDAVRPPSIAEVERRDRHAKVVAAGADARRKANRARRDDITRAMYYASFDGSDKIAQARPVLWIKALEVLEAAGYDRAFAEADMNTHIASGRADLIGWVRGRRCFHKRVKALAAAEAELRARAERRSAADGE